MTTVIASRTRNIFMTTVTRRRRRTSISVLHVLHDDVVISRLRPKIMTQLMTMTTTQQQQLMNPATPTATPTATATATATGATATMATTNKTMIATGGGSTITATTTHPHHYPHHYPHRYPYRCFSTSTSSNTSTSSSNTSSSNNNRSSNSNSNESTKSLRQEIILSSLEDLKKQNKLSNEIEFSINPYELERHGRGESHHRGFDIDDKDILKKKQDNSDESSSESKSIQDDSSSIITPDVIVRPSTTNDVSIILKYCNENKIPIIPFGAGTSVEGHVCALHKGTISLDMTYGKEFQSIILPEDIYNNDNNNNNNDSGNESLPDPIAIVGAGVSRKALNEALRHTGMQFVVDPGAANATIGGMVATGASGTTSIKYGTMRENILELKVVLPVNGTICEKIGTKALKSSAGYDLLSLMCGSEGTLGVIISVTVKLHPIPQHIIAAVCVFDTISDAANTVAMLKLHDISALCRVELLDKCSVSCFNASLISNSNTNDSSSSVKKMEEKPTLFLEFQASTQHALDEQISITQEICCDDFNGTNFQFTSNEDERKALWSARHNLYYASIAYRKGCTTAVLTDSCVPISKFANVIEDTINDINSFGDVIGPCFGHAGDGNFHCILPIRDNGEESDEYMSKVFTIHENIIQRTLDAGGTCTGEHGVGYGKIKYLKKQYGPGTIHMMELIKKAIDPNNIMNPGKVVN